MDQTRTALTTLEQAILKLESAIHETKKTQDQLAAQVADLKQVLRTTHDRLDRIIQTYHQGTK